MKTRRRINQGLLLEQQARKFAKNPVVIEAVSGRVWTYNAFNKATNRLAHGLRAQGCAQGSYIAIMMHASAVCLQLAFAIKKIAAIEVAINTNFRGPALARMIALSRCRMLVSEREFLPYLAEIEHMIPDLEMILVADRGVADCGGEGTDFTRIAVHDMGIIVARETKNLNPDVADSQICEIMFTSGTTGVSKGCPITHRGAIRAAESMLEAFSLNCDDRVYSPYPMFHVGSRHYDILATMLVGASAIVRPGFSVRHFWEDVANYGATWAMALGSVQQLLWSAPPHPKERAHNLRMLWGTPLPVDAQAFMQRFGTRVIVGGGYGSTDAGAVACPMADKRSAGRVRDCYEVAIVDDKDDPVSVGEVGELVVRPREAAIMPPGYFAMPEETVRAWRNLWFHTGDMARLDAEGDLVFVARMSERLRVRGEMVSAFEVEEVLGACPAVEDCAVIGIDDGYGEEEILAVVVLRDGHGLSLEDLRAYCIPRMSKYMVPQHLLCVDRLPYTPTGKVARSQLAASAEVVLYKDTYSERVQG